VCCFPWHKTSACLNSQIVAVLWILCFNRLQKESKRNTCARLFKCVEVSTHVATLLCMAHQANDTSKVVKSLCWNPLNAFKYLVKGLWQACGRKNDMSMFGPCQTPWTSWELIPVDINMSQITFCQTFTDYMQQEKQHLPLSSDSRSRNGCRTCLVLIGKGLPRITESLQMSTFKINSRRFML
jgi:hypothetical protein